MMDLSLAQGFGYVSFVLGISTFYQKDDKKLKIFMLIFNLNHFIHFLLLGSMISALSALLAALRTATSIYVSSKWVVALFMSMSLLGGVWLSDTLWDLWPICGMIIGTYAVFMLKGIKMRLCFLVGAVCWLINNISVGSIGGSLLEITLIFANIMTIYRLYRDRQQLLAISN